MTCAHKSVFLSVDGVLALRHVAEEYSLVRYEQMGGGWSEVEFHIEGSSSSSLVSMTVPADKYVTAENKFMYS